MKAHSSRTRTPLARASAWLPLFLTPMALVFLAPASLGIAVEKPPASPLEVGVQAGPNPALTIFSTSEVTGWTEPCG